jgi:hypothetical protein
MFFAGKDPGQGSHIKKLQGISEVHPFGILMPQKWFL